MFFTRISSLRFYYSQNMFLVISYQRAYNELRRCRPMIDYEKKYRRLKKHFMMSLTFCLCLVAGLGTYFYMNYDYFALKHLISQNYIYTDTLDKLFEEKLGLDPKGQYYKYFDYLVAEIVTEEIYELGQDRYTYLYTPEAYSNKKVGDKSEADQSYFEALDEDTMYLRLTNFSKHTRKFLNDNKEELGEFPNLILDLRNNGGGDITSLYKMLDLYLPKGKILSHDLTRSKLFSRIPKTKKPAYFDYEHIVILQNKYTASSSENMVVALKENLDNVTIIGSESFGKGIGQSTIPLKNGYAIKATTMNWLTPIGHSIHKTGIAPDIRYDPSSKDIMSFTRTYLGNQSEPSAR